MNDTQDEYLEIQKYMYMSAVALTLYDFLLILDDEVRYAWKSKRSLAFYIYLLYRSLLFGYQFWHIYFITQSSNGSKSISTDDLFLEVIGILFFWAFSDGFLTMRVYAISSGNKKLAAYLTVLALGKPVSAIPGYLIVGGRLLRNIAASFSTMFDVSAFIAVVWYAHRDRGVFKFSALVHTIVSQATIYIIFTIFAQVFAHVALNVLEDVYFEPIAFGLFGLLNPALTMRFVLSLRKSVDPGREQRWELRHITTLSSTSDALADTQGTATRETIGMDLDGTSHSWMQTGEPSSSTVEIGSMNV